MKKVAAVVVTFNRLNFLKEIIEALRNQTYKLSAIFVINNSSSDGTAEWLSVQTDLTVITQDNVGSSGGQYTGIKAAYQTETDYIWIMDDDVVPESDCLSILMNDINETIILTPLRYTPDAVPYLNDTLKFNMTNPFKSIWESIIQELDLENNLIRAEGITFEGPLFHKSLIKSIGLPEKKFFIYADDTEFFVRAVNAGFKIYISSKARLNRKLNIPDSISTFNWKHKYIIRNIIAIDVLDAPMLTRIIRPFGYLISWLFRCNNFNDVKVTFRAFIQGYFYKSDNESAFDK
ncbi:MAG: glycosyltransferase family 2 protein [Candidatus Kapabacteria bacterium]|nr:glycosyltransferase family 2 protein [Candidatus Kapabacteria bacterium]